MLFIQIYSIHFKYFGSMLTKYRSCTREIKTRIGMEKEAFNTKISLLTTKLNIELGKKRLRCYTWNIALYGSETWTLRKMESFEIWCWRRMEKIKWSEEVTNEQGDRIGEKRTLLYNILLRKANWIGHILRRNCLLHDVIEGQTTEVKGVGRRRTQLLDYLRNRRRYFEDRERGKRQFINLT